LTRPTSSFGYSQANFTTPSAYLAKVNRAPSLDTGHCVKHWGELFLALKKNPAMWRFEWTEKPQAVKCSEKPLRPADLRLISSSRLQVNKAQMPPPPVQHWGPSTPPGLALSRHFLLR
jgi:hypothetical protein